MSSYRGNPDFILTREASGAALVLLGVGEVQSARNDVICQLGIYGVGELRKREAGRKLVCVAIMKNKSACILLAELPQASQDDERPCPWRGSVQVCGGCHCIGFGK